MQYRLDASVLAGMKHQIHVTHRLDTAEETSIRPRKIVAFDSEDNTAGNVLMWDFFDGKTHESFLLKSAGGPHELLDVMDYIYSLPADTILVAHNLEYDLINLQRDLGYSHVKLLMYAGSRLVSAELKEHGLKMWDSWNLFPGTLRKMAELVGLVKGHYEDTIEDMHKMLEYCQGDTEILFRFMEGFQELSASIGVPLRPTVGSMSMEAFRRHFLKFGVDACSKEQVKKAYVGGRVELFYKGRVEGDIRVSDVNSMYPFVMTYEYPDTGTLESGSIDDHVFGVGEFVIDVPASITVPPLPYRQQGRLFFPTGRLSGSWTYAEVRNAVRHGCKIIEQTKGLGTNKAKRYFEDYIRFFYEKRQESRRSGDEFGVGYWKLFMNNLYGKFSQHTPRTLCSTTELERDDLEPVRTLGPFIVYEEVDPLPPRTSNFMWGVHVTSYARILLHNLMTKVVNAGHKLLYCDTDSVMFLSCDGSNPLTIGTDLGLVDEERFDRAEFMTSKGYWLDNEQLRAEGKCKLASKGVPKDMGLDFLTKGQASFKKPKKLRESLVQNVLANHWDVVTKHARSVYIKRAVNSDGTTRALDVSEIDSAIENSKIVE